MKTYFLRLIKKYRNFHPEKFMAVAVNLESSRTSEVVLYVVGALLLSLPLILFFFARNKKRAQEECFDFTLDNDGVIKQVLCKAREKGVHFDLICTRLGIKQRHLTVYYIPDSKEEGMVYKYLEEMGDPYFSSSEASDLIDQVGKGETKICSSQDQFAYSYMFLYIPEGNITAGWDDAPIDVYFELKVHGQSTLYHFASFVQKIFMVGGKSYIQIIHPTVLSDSQSKEEVRIEPEPETIEVSSVWMYPKYSHFLPKQMSELGKAMASSHADGKSNFSIVNISATGARLRFLKEDLEKLPFTVEKHVEACFFVSVKTTHERSKRMMLWLMCECKGLVASSDKEYMDVRFTFTHWEQIFEQSSSITWKAATDFHRVPPILHWIMANSSSKDK